MSPKNAAAVALGKRGGKARAQNMSPEERSASARKAVQSRWAKADKIIQEMRDAEALLNKTGRRSQVTKGKK